MKASVFRQYDIRGIVDSEFIIEDVYRLSCAIAYYIRTKHINARRVAVGFDGRLHSQSIIDPLYSALVDSGFDVYMLGMCPSPALYFSLHTQKFDAGIMVTASHNTKEYNGMKLCLSTDVLWGQDIQNIRLLYQKGARISSVAKGSMISYPIIPTYIQWLVDHFIHLKGISVSLAVDCAHGTAGLIIPSLLKALEIDATILYESVDGNFPAHEADPTVAQNMIDLTRLVSHDNVHVAVGFDGDADRMAVVTDSGYLLPGDHLFALFAQQIIEQYPGSSMIFDIKVSQGLLELMKEWHVPFYISPTGHAIVKEYMKKYSAILGGELSCHFLFADRYFGYDDGIYTFLRLLELVHISKKRLSQLSEIFPIFCSSPEIRIACNADQISRIISDLRNYFRSAALEILEIDGIRVMMPYGWGLVRASHTQPEITMRFEGKTDIDLLCIKEHFYTVLARYFQKERLQRILHI